MLRSVPKRSTTLLDHLAWEAKTNPATYSSTTVSKSCSSATLGSNKKTARHTWISPDKVTKTKIDFVCVSKRYRNAVTNAKTRPGADCGSDHNPVVNLKVKLKKLKKILHTKKWDLGKINNEEVRANFCQKLLEKMQIANTSFQVDNVINNWKNLKEALETTAKEVIGYKKQVAIKQWMTQEIPDLMDERGRYKNSNSDEEKQKYIRAKNTYPKNV